MRSRANLLHMDKGFRIPTWLKAPVSASIGLGFLVVLSSAAAEDITNSNTAVHSDEALSGKSDFVQREIERCLDAQFPMELHDSEIAKSTCNPLQLIPQRDSMDGMGDDMGGGGMGGGGSWGGG